ncbi:hypothetical protein CHRYSEO8AT_50042 [Chryseobacterium sp. 8AT]|nr:hypothetical protein CHRYSEO8AT_50042 [Chryseobacterium sp. 8AT]
MAYFNTKYNLIFCMNNSKNSLYFTLNISEAYSGYSLLLLTPLLIHL